MEEAAKNNKPRCKAYFSMTPDQIWTRKPKEQLIDEVDIYREIFDYAINDIKTTCAPVLIAEGAGFLPELVKKTDVNKSSYVCIVPTRDFQFKKYCEREWVNYILEGCTDKQAAFNNWMERDAMFALYAAETAEKMGYKTFWTDGMNNPTEMLKIVEKVFEL